MKTINLLIITVASISMLLASCSGEDGSDGPPGTDGISCWDTNGNGNADPEEDINGDNNFNGLDCQGKDGTDGKNGISCWDTNGNGNADPEEDINKDNNFDGLDCQGEDGDDGDDGDDGEDGIDCWDLNGNGTADIGGEENEDINDDGFVDVLDCKGEQGDGSMVRVDTPVHDHSGAEWEISIDPQVTPASDYLYITFLRKTGTDIWYDVPGHLTIDNLNDTYCRRFIREDENGIGIRFHNIQDDSYFPVPEGTYDIFRIFAIRVNLDLGSKEGVQNKLNELKAAGIDTSDYNEVAAYFGYKD